MLPYAAFAVGLSISAIIVAVRLASLHPLSAVKVGALEVCAGAFWLLTTGLGLTTSSLSVKLLILQIGFFGIVLVPACWLALSLIISGYERWLNRRSILALSLVPIITLVLIFANEYHGLLYSNVELNPSNPVFPLILTPGLLFWSVVVAYPYALLLAGSVMLVRRLMLSRRAFRVQVLSLLIACFVPWLFNTLYFFDQTQFEYVEPTSLTLTLAALLVLWRTVHWSGVYITPVAHEVIIDNMSDPVIVLDYEKRVVEINPMAEKLIGRPYSDVVGQTIESVWSEWPRISKLAADKTSGTKEVSFGTDVKRYYELESTRLPGFSAEEIDLLITLRDITERKHIEDAFQESERRLRLVTDNMLDMMIQTNLQGVFQYVSPSHRMLGYEPKDLIGKSIFELIHPDDLERSTKAFVEGIETRSPKRVELRYRNAVGHYVWIESVGNPIFDEEGEVSGAIIGSRDITERRRAEEALRESQDRLSRITDNMLDIVVETDLKGICKYASPSNKVILGYDPEELVGKSLFEFVHPEDIGTVRKLVERAISTDRLWTGGRYECRYRHADGHYVWLEILANIVRDDNGRMIGSVLGARDITDRKRAEETSSRLAAIVESTDDAVIGKTLDGVITSWNHGAAKLYGYSADEVKGKSVSILVPPDRLEELKGMLERVGKGEPVERYETKRIRKDGRTIDVSLTVSPIKDSGGRIVGASTIARDTTERKQMEEALKKYSTQLEQLVVKRTGALQESEKKYRQLVESAQEGLFTYDTNGVVTFVNPFLSVMLGFTPEEMVGKSLLMFVDDQSADDVKAGMRRRRLGVADAYEVRLVRKDGSRILANVTVSPIADEGSKFAGGLALLSDITERKKLETQLVESQRLAAIGEAAAMVGHDLRNPLQGIAGATYLLREESLTTDERGEMLQIIEKNVAYSDGIVNDLLDYARPLQLTLAQTTPQRIVRSALETVQVPERIKINDQTQEQPVIAVDLDRMKRVFINLIENAVDVMPDGGTLTFGSTQINKFAQLSISDTGTGLPKEVIEAPWKPLQTTKAKGMGLGLPIVKRIVDAHKGEILVDTKAGQGTTFIIRLPIKQETV